MRLRIFTEPGQGATYDDQLTVAGPPDVSFHTASRPPATATSCLVKSAMVLVVVNVAQRHRLRLRVRGSVRRCEHDRDGHLEAAA